MKPFRHFALSPFLSNTPAIGAQRGSQHHHHSPQYQCYLVVTGPCREARNPVPGSAGRNAGHAGLEAGGDGNPDGRSAASWPGNQAMCEEQPCVDILW
jgi:hypothetical protein